MKDVFSIVETSDGSRTLYHKDLDEHFHSIHGAVQESRHVFIKNGFDYCVASNCSRPIKVLEIGFGTGLNALLTLDHATKKEIFVDYYALEPFLLELDLVKQLGYEKIEGIDEQIKSRFTDLHQTSNTNTLNNYFQLTKFNSRLEDFSSNDYFDLIYFDAFSFSVHPHLWSVETFLKIYSMMTATSILVTYAAKGIIKRNMKAAGLEVETLPGPPGKREMIRARRMKLLT
jgi:tRNA U34 5-methylaminomethyl-2-thiouridine-forming methyltransferase MnmC